MRSSNMQTKQEREREREARNKHVNIIKIDLTHGCTQTRHKREQMQPNKTRKVQKGANKHILGEGKHVKQGKDARNQI